MAKLINVQINSPEKDPYPDLPGIWTRLCVQKDTTNAGYYIWIPALVVEKQ